MGQNENGRLVALMAALPVLLTAEIQWSNAREAILLGGLEAFLSGVFLVVLWWAGNRWKDGLLLRLLFLAYLLYAGGCINEELWRFYQNIYPRQVSFWAFLLFIIGAALLLAKGQRASLNSLARILSAVALGVLVILVLSGSSIFRWENLSRETINLRSLRPVLLLPEYLIFCWLLEPKTAGEVVSLPLAFWGIQALLAVIAELALGPRATMDWPMYRVALLGKISVFNRLEWLQVLCWLLLLCIRLTLYLWAIKQMFPKGSLPVIALLLAVTSVGAQQLSAGTAAGILNGAGWLLAALALGKGMWHWKKSSNPS